MKTYYTPGDQPVSQIGDALDSLAATIASRAHADNESYTHRLLSGNLDDLLKKINEEALESALAAKDLDRIREAGTAEEISHEQDHLRYEAADVIYHLMVLMERCHIPLEELAAELNARMTQEELAQRSGIALLDSAHINRGHHVDK